MSEVAENSVDKRDSILQGAFDEFCENGFLAASMDRISKRAGASKRTVYLSAQHHLAAAYDLADEIWEPVYLSDDAQEGPTAFREKRAPQWKGC